MLCFKKSILIIQIYPHTKIDCVLKIAPFMNLDLYFRNSLYYVIIKFSHYSQKIRDQRKIQVKNITVILK